MRDGAPAHQAVGAWELPLVTFDPYEIVLTVIGLAALVGAWAPTYLQRRPLSLPVILVGAGALMFALPLPLELRTPAITWRWSSVRPSWG
jgi:hypothetical protein